MREQSKDTQLVQPGGTQAESFIERTGFHIGHLAGIAKQRLQSAPASLHTAFTQSRTPGELPQQSQTSEGLGQQLTELRETAKMYQIELLTEDKQQREALEQALTTLTTLLAEQSASIDRANQELQGAFERQMATLQTIEQLKEMLEAQAQTLSRLTQQQTALYERVQQYAPATQEQRSLSPDTSPQGRSSGKTKGGNQSRPS